MTELVRSRRVAPGADVVRTGVVEEAAMANPGAVSRGETPAVEAASGRAAIEEVTAAGWRKPWPSGDTMAAIATAQTPAPAMNTGRRRAGRRSSRIHSTAVGRSPSPDRMRA